MAKAAHSAKQDIEMAVDAASEAFKTWSETSATERSIILNKIADRIEENLPFLAAVETVDNGKAIRETMAADLPLAVDHFRYFASVIRAEEGSISELDKDTVSIIVHEPIGVIAQIIPWNFPIDGCLEIGSCPCCRKLCSIKTCRKHSNFYYGFNGTYRRFITSWCNKYC
jgi:aldehyde dehydrogenase